MADDFSEIGLDPSLRKVGGLASNYIFDSGGNMVRIPTKRYLNGYEFDSSVERGAVHSSHIRSASITTAHIIDANITTAKIKDASITNAKLGTAVIGTANIGTLSFNEISGGTATLGGTTNGNGLLSVKNAAGSEVVKLDNTGILVTGGSVTINNTSGSAVIDSLGVVGNVVFTAGTSTQGTIQDIAGTTFTNVGGLAGTIVLSRSNPVLFFISAETLTYNVTVQYTKFRLSNVNVGTTIYPGTGAAAYWRIVHDTPGEVYHFALTHMIVLPAGTNVMSLQAASLQSTGTISIGSISHFGYVLLGA